MTKKKKKVEKNSLEETALEIKEKTFNFLAHKPRSKKEVQDRIDYYSRKYKQLDDDKKEEIKLNIIKDLKENNFLDDENYAETFVRQKINSPKTTSKLKVRQFLKKKGIDKHTIEDALVLFTDEKEEENMVKDAEKKLSKTRESNYYKKKQKIISYLASRGYPYSKIYAVVDRVCDVK